MVQENTQPKHVAIIMDGNGTWAADQGMPRTFGHLAGAKKALEVGEHLLNCGIQTVTMWGFSTENWKRPKNEVSALMQLFHKFAVREAHKLDGSDIKVTFIGRRHELPQRLQRVMSQLEAKTAQNKKMHLRLAINYSGTQESVDACNAIITRGGVVTDTSLLEEIYGEVPQYDIVVRSGGENRVSDFPIRHGELFVVDTHWPAFSTSEIDTILNKYDERDRRFGGLTQKTV